MVLVVKVNVTTRRMDSDYESQNTRRVVKVYFMTWCTVPWLKGLPTVSQSITSDFKSLSLLGTLLKTGNSLAFTSLLFEGRGTKS